jgi:hypothetical protein
MSVPGLIRIATAKPCDAILPTSAGFHILGCVVGIRKLIIRHQQ